MEGKYLRKKLKKGIEKFLNFIFVSAVIFVVVFSSFSYQIAFTSHGSSADEGTTVSESSESSGSGSEEAEEEEKEPAEEEKVADEEQSDETDSTGDTAEETPEETPAMVSEQPADTSATQDLETNLLPLVSQNTDTSSNEFWKTCDLSDEEDEQIEGEEFDECRQKTECEEIKICCSEIITNLNIAGSVINAAESDSITGKNEIIGQPESSGNSVLGTETAENETATEETANNESQDNDENNPAEESADAVIVAGDANAQVASVNEINTNIFTENGQEVVENINGDYSGDVNLLETFDSILESSKDLYGQNEDCFEKINIANINVAENVDNTASATAESGENKIINAEGDASIVTGSVQAIASAVNLINTNIVGNNWLFAIVNVFGNWTGDLIVPGEGLLNTPAGKMIFDKITSINYAKNINNFVYSKANTGNNSESSISGNASIETGDAASQASSVNLVNTNIVRNNWFFLMINNAGSWMGRVINWDKDTGEQNTVYEYEFGSLDGGTQNNSGKIVSVYNNNYAEDVFNYVSADADSGNNAIENAGSASIRTGNAGAFASAFNFVNTNITGNNWLFGIVNNAGTWTGDVIFGYPDLDVKLSADKNEVKPGESFDYTIKYKNIGKAKCDNAELMLSLPKYLSFLSDTSGSSQNDGGNYYWSATGLKPGEERSFNISVKLDENVPNEITTLQSSTGVRTETTEKELSNNYGSETVNVAFPPIITIEDGDFWKKGTSVEVSRSEDSEIAMGALANHFIMVKNSGKNTLYNVLVTEKIKDPSGNTAAEYSWAIEKLKKGQKATIQYQIFLSPPAQLGIYKHTALAFGYNEYGFEVKSKKVSAEVRLVGGGGYYPSSEETPAPVEEAIQGAENFPILSFPAMGVEKSELGGYLRWLWLLVLVPIAYYIWKKRDITWQRVQKFASQAANMLSSFF